MNDLHALRDAWPEPAPPDPAARAAARAALLRHAATAEDTALTTTTENAATTWEAASTNTVVSAREAAAMGDAAPAATTRGVACAHNAASSWEAASATATGDAAPAAPVPAIATAEDASPAAGDVVAGGAGGRRWRLSRVGVRVAAVGVLAAAVAAGVTVVQSAGGTDGRGRPRPVVPGVPAAPVANAAEALERAAHAAETRPFTAPRPDQWIFTESRSRAGATPNGPVAKDPRRTRLVRVWRRADGTRQAGYENGRLVYSRTMPTSPPSDYASLAALPTDPDALLTWAYAESRGLGATPEGRYSTAYAMFGAILRDNVLPPRTEAAVFRAIKRIPGVTLASRRVDAAGRPALGLGRLTEGYLSEELLLDPAAYGYLGERAVAIRDHTGRGEDGVRRIRAGDVLNISVRVRAGVVDEPGRTT